MEFDIEKCTMLIISGKDKERKEYNNQIRKEAKLLEEWKITSTWDHRKRKPWNKLK